MALREPAHRQTRVGRWAVPGWMARTETAPGIVPQTSFLNLSVEESFLSDAQLPSGRRQSRRHHPGKEVRRPQCDFLDFEGEHLTCITGPASSLTAIAMRCLAVRRAEHFASAHGCSFRFDKTTGLGTFSRAYSQVSYARERPSDEGLLGAQRPFPAFAIGTK